MSQLPTFPDVLAAHKRLAGHALRTPTLSSPAINQHLDLSLFFKCENLQRIGAFKFRGAWNAMSQLTESARQKGVVTHSSGNHAQAIALCGKLLDIPTTVVMPNNAPRFKRNATAAHGATIIDYDPADKRREEISANLAKTHGYTLVPPFDHPHVIAGQGTAALEMLEDIDDLDLLLIP